MKCLYVLLMSLAAVIAFSAAQAQAPKDDLLSKAAAMLKESKPLRLSELAVAQLDNDEKPMVKKRKTGDPLENTVWKRGTSKDRWRIGGKGPEGGTSVWALDVNGRDKSHQGELFQYDGKLVIGYPKHARYQPHNVVVWTVEDKGDRLSLKVNKKGYPFHSDEELEQFNESINK